MGLLDMNQQGMSQSGLLGAAPQQGVMPMPPEMAQAIQKMKMASPEEKNQFMQQVIQSIAQSAKPEDQKIQVIAEFTKAMQS